MMVHVYWLEITIVMECVLACNYLDYSNYYDCFETILIIGDSPTEEFYLE